MISARKSRTFSRELAVSGECLTNQGELDLTGINDDMDPTETQLEEMCTYEVSSENGLEMDCDYSKTDLEVDSGACASAGGSVVKVDMMMDCEMLSTTMRNMPACLHDTCDTDAYLEMMGDFMDVEDMTDDQMIDCDLDFSESGAASIGSTSIISIALVSLFAMIW